MRVTLTIVYDYLRTGLPSKHGPPRPRSRNLRQNRLDCRRPRPGGDEAEGNHSDAYTRAVESLSLAPFSFMCRITIGSRNDTEEWLHCPRLATPKNGADARVWGMPRRRAQVTG